MQLALSVHGRNAACVRQPVGDLLLRTSEGEHHVRGFVLHDPLARESLSLSDVDDVQERETGIRKDLLHGPQLQAAPAHQLRRERLQELTYVRVVGQIQRHRVLHRIVDESALALELVVGEVGHLRENVGHSVAVRRPRERR